MHPKTSLFLRQNASLIGVGFLLFLLIAIQVLVLHQRGHAVMAMQLRSELRTTAALGAELFTGEELDRIHGANDTTTAVYVDMVQRLNSIRDRASHISYAYIMRRTDDPDVLAFVADADSLATFAEKDINTNGVIEPDEESSLPGDLYDISDVPALQSDAFVMPVADAEITVDQWGELISGYAPIYRNDGTVAGVLGIDMDAGEFLQMSGRAISNPLALLLLCFALVVSIGIAYILWRRKTAMLAELESERSALLALTSHQLGTPLVSLKWWMEILRENHMRCEDPKDEEALKSIEQAIVRIQRIVEDLQAVERMEHDRGMHAERVSLKEAVEATVHDSMGLLHIRKQSMKMNCAHDADVIMDRDILHAILHELLHNASVYSPDGSTISVTSIRKNNVIYLQIADRGCGVPQGEEERIFTKFTRGSNAGIWYPDGKGLGLYIARMVLERAGGRIWVESNDGKGSIFTVSLPVAR